MALPRHDDAAPRLEQLVALDDPRVLWDVRAADVVAERLGLRRRRLAAGRRSRRGDEHEQPPETALTRVLDQPERLGRSRRGHRRRAECERSRNGALVSGLDLEPVQRERVPALGQLARRRRNSFALRQRALERAQPVGGRRSLSREAVALARGVPRRDNGLLGVVRDAGRPRRLELAPQPLGQVAQAFRPQRDALAGAAQAVERRGRGLTPSGGVGQLVLGLRALDQERLEPALDALALERRGRLPLLGLPLPLGQRGQIELGDARFDTGDLPAELLGAFRRRRLQRERTKALARLGLDVARTLDLAGDARQLQLGPVAPPLEAAEPGCFLHERAALGGAAGQDRLDLALPDDRVHARSQPDVRQELDQVGAANRRAVDQVLALATAVQPPEDRDLGEVEVGQPAVRVVEQELDLAPVRSRAARRAGEEDVVRLLGAELARAQAARRPDDRVGDVRLAGPIRTDDHGHALFQPDLDRVRERFEAAQRNRAQVQGAPNASWPLGWRRAPPAPLPAPRPSSSGRSPSRAALPRPWRPR